MHWKLLSVALAAAALSACASRHVTREVIREQPVSQPAPAVVQPSTVAIIQPPPAPQETMPPAPATGYSWVAGHHQFRDGRWVWVPGQWMAGSIRPLPAPLTEERSMPLNDTQRWVPGHWTFVGNDWVWVRGQWR